MGPISLTVDDVSACSETLGDVDHAVIAVFACACLNVLVRELIIIRVVGVTYTADDDSLVEVVALTRVDIRQGL